MGRECRLSFPLGSGGVATAIIAPAVVPATIAGCICLPSERRGRSFRLTMPLVAAVLTAPIAVARVPRGRGTARVLL